MPVLERHSGRRAGNLDRGPAHRRAHRRRAARRDLEFAAFHEGELVGVTGFELATSTSQILHSFVHSLAITKVRIPLKNRVIRALDARNRVMTRRMADANWGPVGRNAARD
jgi:hypothetical protein